MTAQIGDRFILKETEYRFVNICNPIPFNPQTYGITPSVARTACWKGFWCVYDINSKGIFLKDLYVNSENGQYPKINGVAPMFESDDKSYLIYMGHHLYKNLNIKVPYSGKILVGDKFIGDYYIHMGYQQPWAYEILIELIFENGELIETVDHSKIANEIREKAPECKDYDFEWYPILPKLVKEEILMKYGKEIWWL